MKRIPVKSSNLSQVGYNPKTQELEVSFSGGRVYTYEGVSKADYEGLLKAPSAGRYFNTRIKDVCPHREGGCE